MQARHRALALVVAMTGLLAATLPASGQEGDGGQLVIQEAVLDEDGTTRITVSTAGTGAADDISAESFTVVEGGTSIEDVQVTPLRESEDAAPMAVVMAVDVSGSTEGQPVANARDAAAGFVESVVPVGARVGLVTFSDAAQLVVAPTNQVGELQRAIQDLEAAGETALYDAVLVAARTLGNFDGARSIVVFSDGADTVSSADLSGAVAAATAVDASVTTVALQTSEFDVAPLDRLATQTGGRLVTVDEADALQAAFQTVAESFTSQFVLTYDGVVSETAEIDLAVTLSVGGQEYTDEARIVSPRTQAAAGEPRVVAGQPGIFASDAVLVGALAAAFLGVACFLLVLLVPRGNRRVSRTLQRGLRMYDREGKRAGPTDAATRIAQSSFTRSAVDMVSRVPRPEGYDDRVQLRLDRAGWPLRAAEFTALRAGLVVAGFLVGWGLVGSLLLGLGLAVVAPIVPGVLLDSRVASRQARFLQQLPDTLQLLAGALKAGYGILQAVDTVVKEAPEPTASEFSRVLTESRLGLPLEESLEDMAERVDSEDFRWVVVAINIQRRVGGNLAELLDTVADTLREREGVRRQIKTLSAEGRLSAIILTILPFAVGLYLFVVNPDYIGTLLDRTVGLYMIAGAIAFMGVGIVWMRRLIDIDV